MGGEGTTASTPRNKKERKQLKRLHKLAAKKAADAKPSKEMESQPEKTESKKRSGKLLDPPTRLKKRVKRNGEEKESTQQEKSEEMPEQKIGHDDADKTVQQLSKKKKCDLLYLFANTHQKVIYISTG